MARMTEGRSRIYRRGLLVDGSRIFVEERWDLGASQHSRNENRVYFITSSQSGWRITLGRV